MEPSVWLIERGRTALFLGVSETGHGFRWVGAHAAIRFARRQDAEATRLALHRTTGDGTLDRAVVTEHIFQAADAA